MMEPKEFIQLMIELAFFYIGLATVYPRVVDYVRKAERLHHRYDGITEGLFIYGFIIYVPIMLIERAIVHFLLGV